MRLALVAEAPALKPARWSGLQRAPLGADHDGASAIGWARSWPPAHTGCSRRSTLSESLTGANVHDTHELFALLDAVPEVEAAAGPSPSSARQTARGQGVFFAQEP
jgi:hypothetical protein